MAKQKFYAVAKGRVPGIYTTWDNCKAQVDKYPGAIYKSFPTEEEARDYLSDNSGNKDLPLHSTETKKKKTSSKDGIKSKANVKFHKDYIDPIKLKKTHDFICFVDGSYDKNTKVYGSGVVILSQIDDGCHATMTAGIDEYDQWNIVGELEAALHALSTAVNVGAEKVVIYHDLINIALWATGAYRAKNEYTQNYVRKIEEYSKQLDITFVKVKGHSDNRYNDAADEMADRAVKMYNEYLQGEI